MGAVPDATFKLDVPRAALVLTDPQVDFLSPAGVAWSVVGDSVQRNHTVENIERLLRAASRANMLVAISPHYYYPSDHRWGFGGPLERFMDRCGVSESEGPIAAGPMWRGGAEVMPQYRPYLLRGRTVVAPHKAYGPDSSDLAWLLHRFHVDQVVLGGMSANLCVESHLRALLDGGFEVAVVGDATAAAALPGGDGYLAAIINFRFIANALWSTDEALTQM